MSQTPKWWLSAGAGVFLLSVLVGYHQDQIAADSVLAGKIGIPPMVRIQDYDRQYHSNLLNEVRFLGEADVDHPIGINVGTEEAPHIVQVVPVYPVTSESTPMALWYLRSIYDAVRRPMPRISAPAIAAASGKLAEIERKACAFVISEGEVSDDIAVIGQGLNGPLISLFGSITGGGEIETAARAVLQDRGLTISDTVQIVALYPEGKRPATPIEDFSASRRMLEFLALCLFGIGMLRTFLPFGLWRGREGRTKFEEVQAVREFPGVFEPIRAQEDILREEQDASERRAAATRRVFSRLA